MDAEAAFWEGRGEGAAATLGKFANDWGADYFANILLDFPFHLIIIATLCIQSLLPPIFKITLHVLLKH